MLVKQWKRANNQTASAFAGAQPIYNKGKHSEALWNEELLKQMNNFKCFEWDKILENLSFHKDCESFAPGINFIWAPISKHVLKCVEFIKGENQIKKAQQIR